MSYGWDRSARDGIPGEKKRRYVGPVRDFSLTNTNRPPENKRWSKKHSPPLSTIDTRRGISDGLGSLPTLGLGIVELGECHCRFRPGRLYVVSICAHAATLYRKKERERERGKKRKKEEPEKGKKKEGGTVA